MIFHLHPSKRLSQLVLLGIASTGFSLLSIDAARASDVTFNFKVGLSGTAPFESNNSPGNDADETNNFVRTQDVITYKWEYAVNNGAANNVVLKATVPNNVEILMPAVCGAGSQIATDPIAGNQSITCALGTVFSGSSGAIDLKARVLSQNRAPSNAFVANGNTTNATGSIVGSNISNIINPVTTGNLTISAAPKVDLFKQSAFLEGGAKGQDGVTDGVVIRYPIMVALTGGGKGSEAITSNLQFTDTLVYNGGPNNGLPVSGAKLYTWRPGYSTQTLTPANNSSCNRMGGDAWAYYGGYPNGKINSSYYVQFGYDYGNPNYSTADSGTWTCSQPGGAGTAITFNITGADTTANHVPIKDYYGGSTLPADTKYLVAGALHIWLPLSAITANGGQLNVRNQLSALTATGASGLLNQEPTQTNNYYDHTLVGSSGNFTSHYATSVDDRGGPLPGMSAIYGGDGVVMPSQTYTDRVYIRNNGGLPWAPGSILCTAIDNKTQVVTPLSGSTTNAVKNFSYYTGVLGTDYIIEYGTGNYNTVLEHQKATCRDVDSSTGWTSNLANVPGGADAVTKVRVRAISPTPIGGVWDIAVNLKARNNYLGTTTQIPIGTLLVQHSSFFIPGYPYQGPGVPTGWYGGFYQRDINYYVGWGDRLAMTRAVVRIDKQNEPNNPIINAAAGSQVTFILKPTITAPVNPPPVNPNVVITDILPATMTYVVGSATTVTPTVPPIVIPIVPTSVTTNADGTTTIIWDLGPRVPNETVPDISYKASIRLDAPNNSTAINTATIESVDDASPLSARTDTVSVSIGNAASFRIFKEVAQALINPNGTITYSLNYANTGSSDVGASRFIDVLPYSNDGRIPQTTYTGLSTFNSITGTNGETFEFTNRPHNQINSDPDDPSNLAGGLTKWCLKNAFNTPGCPTENVTAMTNDVTGIRINAPAFPKNLPTRKLTLNLTTKNNSPNDIYTNRFTGRTVQLIGLLESNYVSTRVKVPAKVLLVKRITAINQNAIGTLVNNPNLLNDTHINWPANYLKGAIDGGKVKPGDELEYTIYFMNVGDNSANKLKICDRLMPKQIFQPDTYEPSKGIQFKLGSNAANNLTNAADPIDRAQFVLPNQPLPSNCNLSASPANNDGVVVVEVTGNSGTGTPNITEIPGAITPGNPIGSYGFVRFTTKVK